MNQQETEHIYIYIYIYIWESGMRRVADAAERDLRRDAWRH